MCRLALLMVSAALLLAPRAVSAIAENARRSETVGPLVARRMLQLPGLPGGPGQDRGSNVANQAANTPFLISPSPGPLPAQLTPANGNPTQQPTTTTDQFPGLPATGQTLSNNMANPAAASTPAPGPGPSPAQQNPANGNPAQQQATTTDQVPGSPGTFGSGQTFGNNVANPAAINTPSPSPSSSPAQQFPAVSNPTQQQTNTTDSGATSVPAGGSQPSQLPGLPPLSGQQQQGSGNSHNRPVPGNLGSDVGSIVNNAISSSQADAAASAITTAGSQGNAQAAANSIVQQSAAGRTNNIADAIVQSIATNTAATAAVLASAAAQARTRGSLDSFADSQAQCFVKARGRGRINAYTDTVAQTINSGGDDATQAYGVAFAKAAAGSSDQQQALAEATAVAFCAGGSQAQAFASAYAVALSRDERTGCLVLSQARALAVARCNGGDVQVYTEAEAQSRVIGYCKKRYPDLPGFVNFVLNGNFNHGLNDLLGGITGK